MQAGQAVKLSPQVLQVCSNLPVLKKFSAAELQSVHAIFLWRLYTVVLLAVRGERTHVVSHFAHMTAGCSSLDTAAFVVEQPDNRAVAVAQAKDQRVIVFIIISFG